MEIQGKDVALYLSGQPIPVPDCNIVIYQPTIKQIVACGEDNFLLAISFLGSVNNFIKSVRMVNPQLDDYNNFQILMMYINEEKNMKAIVELFFSLIFPIYTIEFKEDAILFRLTEHPESIIGIMRDEHLDNFSQIINEIFVVHGDKEEEFNPANEKAQKIADIINAGRKKRRAMNTAENRSSLFGTYASILSVGLCMDINIFFNYTPFQLYDCFKRYWAKVGSDFYQKISTTPLMDVSKMEKPKEWTRNLY